MKVIVGLGNPGKKYKDTRHNVGFMFLDHLVETFGLSDVKTANSEWKSDKYLLSEIYKTKFDNEDLFFAKPQTFMNKSGQAVKKLVTNYKLRVTSDLIVIHDDLDISLGKFKIQKGVGPKLHNGISSIEQHLRTQDFVRVRIGVDARTPDRPVSGETYVLENFLPEEKKIIADVFQRILDRLRTEYFTI
ncbi:MAG: aminoacyl-tRNA hydrolase [bacterium]|nr:aminoacyl-tRNA hydrolase [bacterium]